MLATACDRAERNGARFGFQQGALSPCDLTACPRPASLGPWSLLASPSVCSGRFSCWTSLPMTRSWRSGPAPACLCRLSASSWPAGELPPSTGPQSRSPARPSATPTMSPRGRPSSNMSTWPMSTWSGGCSLASTSTRSSRSTSTCSGSGQLPPNCSSSRTCCVAAVLCTWSMRHPARSGRAGS
jgi:hypothetical protein